MPVVRCVVCVGVCVGGSEGVRQGTPHGYRPSRGRGGDAEAYVLSNDLLEKAKQRPQRVPLQHAGLEKEERLRQEGRLCDADGESGRSSDRALAKRKGELSLRWVFENSINSYTNRYSECNA